jgi:hypothetical protein
MRTGIHDDDQYSRRWALKGGQKARSQRLPYDSLLVGAAVQLEGQSAKVQRGHSYLRIVSPKAVNESR